MTNTAFAAKFSKNLEVIPYFHDGIDYFKINFDNPIIKRIQNQLFLFFCPKCQQHHELLQNNKILLQGKIVSVEIEVEVSTFKYGNAN